MRTIRFTTWLFVAAFAGLLVLVAWPGRAQNLPTTSAAPTPNPFKSDEFHSNWYDQRAELAGYDLTFPRYGQIRHGTAVTIYVTEPFSNSARVKADDGKHPDSDVFPVMKLNLVEDFATGVYDYNLMTSVFVALAPVNDLPAGTPTKISFSSQEWCGNVYQQLLFDSHAIRSTKHSYFDGEGDTNDSLDFPAGGISEDALPFWARQMAQPFLAPGEIRTVPILRSVESSRLLHKPLAWEDAQLSRGTTTTSITVPAGTFDVETWTAVIGGNRTWTFCVEAAFPHRVIRWECSDGQHAELLGVQRMTYWKMHDNGFEDALSKLGLKTRPPHTT